MTKLNTDYPEYKKHHVYWHRDKYAPAEYDRRHFEFLRQLPRYPQPSRDLGGDAKVLWVVVVCFIAGLLISAIAQ